MLYGLRIQMYSDNTAAIFPVYVIHFVIVSNSEVLLFCHKKHRAVLQRCNNVMSVGVWNINIRKLAPEYNTTIEW
jgi:hypothetical protein